VQAIEPIIGHLKADHQMNRCHLKCADGNSLHAAGYNIRWLLRMIVKKLSLFLRLLQVAGLTDFTDLQRKLSQILNVNPDKSASMN
jgi:IS5 family transposase